MVESWGAAMQQRARAERFFFDITVVMIVVIIAGFGSAAMFLDEFVYPPSTMLIFHAIVMLAWYFLTASQARLISQSNFVLHKQMGMASIALVILMIVTGYVIVSQALRNSAMSIAGMSPAGSTIFPTMDLIGFTLFYGLALANRKSGAAHKRLMVLAGIMMLPPATARLGLSIGFEPLAGVAAIGFTGALLIYDWRTRGRPHWASVLGVIVGVGGTPVRFVAGPSEGWGELAKAIYL